MLCFLPDDYIARFIRCNIIRSRFFSWEWYSILGGRNVLGARNDSKNQRENTMKFCFSCFVKAPDGEYDIVSDKRCESAEHLTKQPNIIDKPDLSSAQMVVSP